MRNIFMYQTADIVPMAPNPVMKLSGEPKG